jgi:hypothetical protein
MERMVYNLTRNALFIGEELEMQDIKKRNMNAGFIGEELGMQGIRERNKELSLFIGEIHGKQGI